MELSKQNCTKVAFLLGIDEFKPPSCFEVCDLLGRGRTGSGVFKAPDQTSKQKYAAKIFQVQPKFVAHALSSRAVQPSSVALYHARKFRAVRELQHANIVKYFFQDVSYAPALKSYQKRIFMECCNGDTLERDMGNFYENYKTGYKAPDVYHYFLGLLSGLDYLQHHHIVHRDLRPEKLIEYLY
ncbi:uncharacterized protein LOC129596875 [Paramacrobiotus metropolitanus]|uniref:uncharacterized protein LOC129596875 n=1 Tax=Paramacrobiotus metropolitanus TaxID=2943436 RepID=UPI002445AE52|nr:uncharacterized protein LOC129596875 [Paramacrobiotus metropolitanus]